jgi:hypothetical protein
MFALIKKQSFVRSSHLYAKKIFKNSKIFNNKLLMKNTLMIGNGHMIITSKNKIININKTTNLSSDLIRTNNEWSILLLMNPSSLSTTESSLNGKEGTYKAGDAIV